VHRFRLKDEACWNIEESIVNLVTFHGLNRVSLIWLSLQYADWRASFVDVPDVLIKRRGALERRSLHKVR
jgi:hypothetical protein